MHGGIIYERNHEGADSAVHGRLRRSAEAHSSRMIDLIIFISLFGGFYYMNIKENLIRGMQTIGEMRFHVGE